MADAWPLPTLAAGVVVVMLRAFSWRPVEG